MADEKKVETEEERRARIRRARRRKELRRRRRRRRQILQILKLAAIVLVVILAVVGIVKVVQKVRSDSAARAAAEAQAEEDARTLQQYKASEVLHLSFPVLTIEEEEDEENSFIDEDGDGIPDDLYTYEDDTESVSAESEAVDVHALTVSEFEEILQQLYDDNYVLVDMYSLAGLSEAMMAEKSVSVPIGKKPLIISQYDAAYSSGYNGHADRLTFDTSGNITCEYTDSEGTVLTGSVDVIPCLENFIEKHADFSYNGARGIIGVTGYNGLLGYQVTADSKRIGSLSSDAIAAIEGSNSDEEEDSDDWTDDAYAEEDETSDLSDEDTAASSASDSTASETTVTQEDISQNITKLNDLITVLRKKGWHFASNSYNYISYASSFSLVKEDADLWEQEIESIIGTTDILILPLGADIDSWSGYSADNQKFTYLKELGFRYYCTENEQTLTWLQMDPEYLRQGYHAIDCLATFENIMQL